MAYPNRPLPSSSLRHPSLGGAQTSSSNPSPMLVARINEKRAELENLKRLRDLSSGLAMQMQTLEQKISTLSNGTEAVAAVLSNWHNVLRAINMASVMVSKPPTENKAGEGGTDSMPRVVLPQTLVRIPVDPQQAEHQQDQDGK